MPGSASPDSDLGIPEMGWAARYAAALEAAEAARLRAQADPTDPALEIARWDALGDVLRVERAMATELILMLRKADQRSGLALRAVLTAIVGDVIDGRLDGVKADLDEVADAVARLERGRRRKGVAG